MPAAVAVFLVLAIGVGMVVVNGTPPASGPSVAYAPTHLGVYQPPPMPDGSAPLDDYYVSCERYHQAYASPEDVHFASY